MEGPRVDWESDRYGEQRHLSVAILRDRMVAVVWTVRGPDAVRLISARRARHAEEGQYRQIFG
jgi:uncharacterized DUF497 family protein